LISVNEEGQGDGTGSFGSPANKWYFLVTDGNTTDGNDGTNLQLDVKPLCTP